MDRNGRSLATVAYEGAPGLKLLLRILQQSPLHEQLISSIRTTTNDPDLRLRASIKTIPFRPKHRDGKSPCFSKSFWHILSIFSVPHDKKFALVTRDAAGKQLAISSILTSPV